MANHYLGTKITKKSKEAKLLRKAGWGKFPLEENKILYAALDARLGLELAKKHWGVEEPAAALYVPGDEEDGAP